MFLSHWLWKEIIFSIFLILSLHIEAADGHHTDKCLTPDGRQGICVVRRYCREANKGPLLFCNDDARHCCPIPTSQTLVQITPASTTAAQTTEHTAKAVSERPIYGLSNKHTAEDHSKQPANSGDQESIGERGKEIEHSRKTTSSYGSPAAPHENYPKTHIRATTKEEEERLRPTSPHDIPAGTSTKSPFNERPFEERLRKPVQHSSILPETVNGRNREQDERLRKPISSYDRPVEYPHKFPENVGGRPRYEERQGYQGNGSRINGKVRFEDEGTELSEIHPVEEYHPDRRLGPVPDHNIRSQIPGKVRFEEEESDLSEIRPEKEFDHDRHLASHDDEKKKPHHPSESRQGTPAYSSNRDIDHPNRRINSTSRHSVPRPSPSHYPSKDHIEIHRDLDTTRNSKPTLTLGREESPKAHFPPAHEFSVHRVPSCGVKPYELFIAGGEKSHAHEWPWMTAIFRRHQSSRPKTFLCGGSLINTKYVLTAAHCFVHNYVVLPESSFVVRLGSHQLNSGEEYTVSNLVIHLNHSGSDFFNDIALVRLAGEVYITDKIAPICLPYPDMVNEDLVGSLGTVAGWGDTAFRTGGSVVLQHVAIPIVSGDECFSAYSRVRGAAFLARGSDHVLCAGLREGGKDACLGDSGGPLMMKTPSDQWIVVGIVSLGYKCAEPGYPGVYTRVTHYLPWILENMKRH